MRSKWVATVVCAVALAAASGVGFELHGSAAAQQAQAPLPSPQDLSRTFINVAKQIKPAVVNIDVVEKSKRASSMHVPEGFPQIPGFPNFGDGVPRRQKGTGSGVIISSDGYILTNNHVAGDADQINVKLADGREFKARLVGKDRETDLAVVKIDAQSLPFARLGNSDALEQGEWVIALGSPFGLQQTMTAGIVSATGRDLGVQGGQFTNFIQTDASINPGNSGGPLVNMQGEVVGINTLIFSQTGTSAGVGFAIPSNLATKVYAQLIKSGKVTRGYLGVYLQSVSPSLARTVGYNGTEGAVVGDLTANDSPAARAGLRSGDVIVAFDGKPVKSPKQLTEIVADTPVGKSSEVQYVRDGHVETTSIRLGERPTKPGDEDQPENGADPEQDAGKLGASVSNITGELARQMKLKMPGGVMIQNVKPDSPAAEAQLQRGDVIHRVNRTPINNRQDFVRAMASVKDEKEITLQVERNGQLQFVPVTLD
ncbi:MAG TPA: Do family serine endopeptidase [Blastocatellia bacterium]